MSAVLTHNLSNIDKITFFMEESKRMNIPVLGPDVNESQYNFAVNKKGEIRFGLGAVKGVGESAVAAIIDERTKNGGFKNIFDLTQRITNRSANKRCLESMAQAGGFDCFEGIHRAQYFAPDAKDQTSGIDRAIRFGNNMAIQQNSAQNSLFGDASISDVTTPSLAECEPWSNLELLHKEKEVIGFYISGHPLDNFRFEMNQFCPNKISQLKELEKYKDRDMVVGGMITAVNHRVSKTGKPFGNFTIEDYGDSIELVLFGQDYVTFKQYLELGFFLRVIGKSQERYHQPGSIELKVLSMELLSELREKKLRSITVHLQLNELSDTFVKNLITAVKENSKLHHRHCDLHVNVFDKEENIFIKMPSRKFRVNPDNAFIDSLNNMPEVMEVKYNEN